MKFVPGMLMYAHDEWAMFISVYNHPHGELVSFRILRSTEPGSISIISGTTKADIDIRKAWGWMKVIRP
jgi:hypothetical protein